MLSLELFSVSCCFMLLFFITNFLFLTLSSTSSLFYLISVCPNWPITFALVWYPTLNFLVFILILYISVNFDHVRCSSLLVKSPDFRKLTINHYFFNATKKCPALPLKFCELPEDERSKSVKEGSPLVLRCELCQDTTAEVFWSRDGTQLLPGDIDIQSDGLVKKLCIHSVDRTHAGIYQCSTAGDSITITVEIKGDSCLTLPCSVLFIF